jgi:hypothetical protein
MLGTRGLSFFTLSNDRKSYIFKSSRPIISCFSALVCLHPWARAQLPSTMFKSGSTWQPYTHLYITIGWEARRALCSLSAVDRNHEVCGPRVGNGLSNAPNEIACNRDWIQAVQSNDAKSSVRHPGSKISIQVIPTTCSSVACANFNFNFNLFCIISYCIILTVTCMCTINKQTIRKMQ